MNTKIRDPEVPTDVDPDTGIWRTDGMPMVYLPRHFLVNNHLATVLELSARQGLVALENSVFVLEAASRADQPICYMFEGFVLGALRFLIASGCIGGDHHKIVCEETQCAAMGQHDRCLIRFIETGQ